MTGRTTTQASGRIVRTKPSYQIGTTTPIDFSAGYTCTAELYPPDGGAPISKSATGGDDGRVSFATASADWTVAGVTLYGRWGIRLFADDGGGTILESPLGYIHVSAPKHPG